MRLEIKYGNDNEENGNGAPVLTVVELPHAAKQTNRLPFFNFISGPPAWKQNEQKIAKVACIATCSKLVPKGQCFLTKYLGEGINLWLFRNLVTLLCPVSAGCVYSVIKLSRILLFLVDNILPAWRPPSPAPLALGSNVIANLNIFIWHFMFSNGHNNLCLRILLIQRQRNGNSSDQMCIAWILEMLSEHP